MKAIQLHDRFSEEIVGTILTQEHNYNLVCEEWDKYQSIHAVKVCSELNWESHDYSAQIKEKMIENRGGLGTSKCLHVDCSNMQVKTSAYCIQHLYATGARV